MIKHLIIILSLIVLCGSAGAESNAEMDSCNLLFHDASYQQAVTCYESIGTSAEILFNIGNSYARMGENGYAILYYLRSLCLSPGDADTSANLAHIRKENSLFPPEPSFSDQVFSALTISQWSYLCLALLIVYVLFLFSTLLKTRQRAVTGSTTLACLLTLALCCAGVWYHYGQWQRSVVVEDERLLVSPFDKSESFGAISAGRLVTVHRTYGDYVYVTDETGRKGWLHGESRRPVLPDEQ